MFENISSFFNREIIKGGKKLFSIDYYRSGSFNIEPNARGLYAWYFFPKNATKMDFRNFSQVLNNKNLFGEISSNFQEKYNANLNSVSNDKHCVDMNYNPDVEKAIIASSILFTPPIYIGRSEDLKVRLEEHDKNLRESLMARTKFDLEDLKSEDIDTEKESKNFGERVSNYIVDQLKGNDSFDNLNFIAIAIQFHSENIKKEDIIKMEYFLNRTIKPIFGVK